MNYRECYEWGRQSLKAAGIEEADLDARLLLETICHTDRNTLLVHGDRQVSHEEESAYNDWISRRCLLYTSDLAACTAGDSGCAASGDYRLCPVRDDKLSQASG